MKKLGTDARLKKKLQEVLDLTTAENAAMDNANNPSASNPFATMADVENVELGDDIVDALAGAGDPSSSNPFATISDITDLGLDSDELDAIESSNNPSTANPFATLADLPEGGGITDVTYAELVALMDSSGDGLVPGQFYRITDFATVHYMTDDKTATADINTGSTEPLIVLAISESALDSRAYSELYPYDVIHYDWNPANWLTDISFGGNDETLVTGFKGVIYFRHDTLHDNYMGYDFRNVKFRRWNNGSEVGSVWVSEYQSYKSNGAGVTDPEDYIDVLTFNCPGGEEQYNNEVRGIHIEAFKDQSDLNYYTNSILCNNVFYLEADYGWYQVFTNTIGSLSCFNTFNGYINANIIGNDFHCNTIGNDFHSNTIENDFHSNTIGNNFNSNTIGNNFYGNTIENDFYSNIIGNVFNSNTIGDSCQNITAENKVTHITIADSCTNIRIGNSSSYIELGDSSGGVNNIDIGQNCGGNGKDIVIGGGSSDVRIEDGCHTITMQEWAYGIIIHPRSNTINLGVSAGDIEIGSDSYGITIGDNCWQMYFGATGGYVGGIIIGKDCYNIICGINTQAITIAESSYNVKIGQGSSHIELGDSSGGVNNIDIGQGCGGSGQDIVIGGDCSNIEVGNGCDTINIGSASSCITIGNSIWAINIGIWNSHCFFSEDSSEITIGDYCSNLFFRGGCNSTIVIGDSVRYLTVNTCFMIVVGNQSTSNSFYMCQSITIPEKSFCNEFKGCLIKDYTDSLINQITNGVFITHQPITSSYEPQPVSDIVEIYIEEDSEGLHQIITRDIIGVSV